MVPAAQNPFTISKRFTPFPSPDNTGNHQFGERVLGFSTDLVTEKAIRWMKEQDGNQPFLMCCHFKATHEPYDYPIRMEHLYDGVTFPEPENLLDWGPETNGRSFKGQTLEELERRWRIASQDPDKWWPCAGSSSTQWRPWWAGR